MSKIKALDKLRGRIRLYNAEPALTYLSECADEIEREIQERYMELPVDADGVPIHVGDVMAMADGREGTVVAVGESQFTIHVSKAPNVVCQAKMHHHVKPRTLEDVLCDMIHEYGCTDALTETIADKYAAEIRELLGGDAE